jgi:Fe-S-cluster-containing dehydrogenase component/DMSO reductase anchor subunit
LLSESIRLGVRMSLSLPLLTRATPDGTTYRLRPRDRSREIGESAGPPGEAAPEGINQRMPTRAPETGEQYRFHVDMGACIGCKCCVVACNEQNGNPAAINWRRVGEVEGGWYPNTQRSYLSMGCNHCVEPTCLAGCPVDAYTKDPATGIVHHSADTCIGCQYCTWNCSYGVPQFNPERGVVGKCDMCHGRLSRGQEPACVSACPEGAIAIEIVNVSEWKAALAQPTPASGLPAEDASLSTTRLTMPAHLPPNARPLDLTHVKPEDPHWPLVVMTVLTQLSVGTFVSIWLLELAGAVDRLGAAALSSLAVGGLALASSTLHLGRPIHAYRAIRMWRRSWLSREVLLFAAFSNVAALYAAALWYSVPGSVLLGGLTAVLGVGGVTATACIYRVASRPSWNTPLTPLRFGATTGLLGALWAAAAGAGDTRSLTIAAAAFGAAQVLLVVIGFLRMIGSHNVELGGTARLLSTRLAPHFVVRGVLLASGGIVLPLLAQSSLVLVAAGVLALAGELLGRYLFFVSVVPKHMTTPYLAMGSEAA